MEFTVLFQNVAMLIALTVVEQFIELRWRGSAIEHRILSGLLFGTVAVVGMAAPYRIANGIIFDGRTIVLSIAGLFGGPIVAGIAAGMAGIYRLSLGGGGTLVGLATIAESALLGTLVYYLRRKDPRVTEAWQLYAFGLVVHVITLLTFLALPGDPLHEVFPAVALPMLIAYPLGVVFIGRILVEQENRYLTTISSSGETELAQFVAENTADVIWLMDTEFVFRYANPAVERMFGYTPTEFLGSRLSDMVDAEHMATIKQIAKDSVAALPANDGVLFETEMRTKDGAIRPIEVSAKILLSDHERPLGFYGSSRDITYRKRLEAKAESDREALESLVAVRTRELRAVNERLREKNEELLDANDAKTRFLRAMSHELRTPLNSIIGFSNIMARGMAGELNPEQLRQAEMINHSGQHLLSLINDILDLSRIEAGRLELEFAEFDIVDLARDAMLSIQAQAEAKRLDVRLELPDAPVEVTSDSRKVRQIILNLAGNAVKFTDEGSITLRMGRPDHGMARIEISDTGPGIAAEDLDHIFDEFVQVGAQAESNHDGSGLGLAIVRGLARALGGAITVSSSEGEGSTFSLVLPVEPPVPRTDGEGTAD